MAHKKYKTEQERLEAKRTTARNWYHKNKDRYLETQDKWLEKNGFDNFQEYIKTTPSYQKSLKNNQPGKFKKLHDDKPENTKQHPIFTDYHITENGDVWKFSDKRKSWLKIKTQENKTGYYTIQLYIGKKRYLKYHHKIVAEAWLGICPDDKEVDHINAKRWDNKVSNLQYLTRSENLLKRPKRRKKSING